MNNEIKAIHEWKLFGEIVEMGCGVPVASALYAVWWASKTVYQSLSPYHKDVQKQLLGKEFRRSVSAEFVQAMVSRSLPVQTYNGLISNFQYAASFQLGDKETNDENRAAWKPVELTHGWIGLRLADTLGGWIDNVRLYHLSIREDLSREEIIRKVGQVGIAILYNAHQTLAGGECVPLYASGCIDMVLSWDSDNVPKQSISETIQTLGPKSLVAMNSQGELVRPEELIRDKKLIIFKWSFNPPHKGHMQVMEHIQTLYPDHSAIFSISVNTYDKGKIDAVDMERRIRMLNMLGYPVLLFGSGYYIDNLRLLRYNNAESIVFPVGVDVADKIILDPQADLMTDFGDKVHFVEFGRKGEKFNGNHPARPATLFSSMDVETNDINSTDIRKLIAEGNITDLKAVVDEKIIWFSW